MQVAFNDDIGRGNPEDGFQCRDNFPALQAAVGIENKAVSRCFIHDPTAGPFVVFCRRDLRRVPFCGQPGPA